MHIHLSTVLIWSLISVCSAQDPPPGIDLPPPPVDPIAAGEVPAGEVLAGAVPVVEVPVGEVSVGEIPADAVLPGEVPAGEVPADVIVNATSFAADAIEKAGNASDIIATEQFTDTSLNDTVTKGNVTVAGDVVSGLVMNGTIGNVTTTAGNETDVITGTGAPLQLPNDTSLNQTVPDTVQPPLIDADVLPPIPIQTSIDIEPPPLDMDLSPPIDNSPPLLIPGEQHESLHPELLGNVSSAPESRNQGRALGKHKDKERIAQGKALGKGKDNSPPLLIPGEQHESLHPELLGNINSVPENRNQGRALGNHKDKERIAQGKALGKGKDNSPPLLIPGEQHESPHPELLGNVSSAAESRHQGRALGKGKDKESGGQGLALGKDKDIEKIAKEKALGIGKDKGVDVPPPPPMLPNFPSLLFSEDVGSTTVEISANMTDALNRLMQAHMDPNGTTLDIDPITFDPPTTTPMSVTVKAKQSTSIPDTLPTVPVPSPKETVDVSFVPKKDIFDLPTIDHPPPIFTGNRRPPMFDMTPGPPTVKYEPQTVSPDVPPPPIIFPSRAATTTFNEPIASPQNEARIPPFISPIEQMRRMRQKSKSSTIPPRFLSVSDLAELAFHNFHPSKKHEPASGFQVFFNTRPTSTLSTTTTATTTPIPTTTTPPAPPMSMIGSAGFANNQLNPVDFGQSLAVGSRLPVTQPGPIEKKSFYDANYLLSHLADLNAQSNQANIATRITTEKPFFDANYLLTHLSDIQTPQRDFRTPAPTHPPRSTAAVLTLSSSSATENLHKFFPHELQRIQKEKEFQRLQQQEQLRKQLEIKERQLELERQQQLMQQQQLEHQRQQQILIEQQQQQIAEQTRLENLRRDELQQKQLQQQQKQQELLLRAQIMQSSSAGFMPKTWTPSVTNVKPGLIEQANQEQANNNILKAQRQTHTDTRPMNFRNTPSEQTVIDYNLQQPFPVDPRTSQSEQDNFLENLLTNLRGDYSNFLPRSYVYGDGNVLTPPNTQQSSNRLSTLREKFNRNLKAAAPTAPLNEQIATSELRSLLGVRDNIHMNNEFLNSGMQYTVKVQPDPAHSSPDLPRNVPRTGSDVRRIFNQHMKTEATERSPTVNTHQQNQFSSLEQTFLQKEKSQDLPLKSRVAVDTSGFHRQAPTAPRNNPFNVPGLNTLSSINIFKAPALSNIGNNRFQREPSVKSQTHWSVPSEEQIHSDHVLVRYALAPSGQVKASGFPLPADPASDLSSLHVQIQDTIKQRGVDTNNRPTPAPVVEFPLITQGLQQFVTTMPTTRRQWRLTTMSPTLPPTADPNPPAIFSKNIQVTFMPMPKIDPPKSKPSKNATEVAGWEEGKNVDPICRGCVFVNERCLLPDRKHCNMYTECVRQGTIVRAFSRECAIGLFFDRSSYLCVDPSVADCPTDRCREGITSYVIQGHCKNYWQCDKREGGRYFAVRACCPDQGGFVEGRGCVQDSSCSENCNLTATVKQDPIGCKLRKAASPTKYYDEDARVERPCAPGTLFDELKCTCVQDISIERSEAKLGASCTPKLHLTFDSGKVEDVSLTKQHVGVEGVVVSREGGAIMTGAGKLILWRYANLMFPVVFAVRLRFRSTSPGPRIQQIISNCSPKGGAAPSFDISLDTFYHEVIITVKTFESTKKQFKLTFQQDTWTTVDFIYDGERIVGSVDGRARNILAAGLIETRPNPIIIGSCDGKTGFKGLIDDVHFYEDCIPDDMFGVFMSVLQ